MPQKISPQRPADVMSDGDIFDAIAEDYLAFTLDYDLGVREASFELQAGTENSTLVSLLGNGIIAFYPNSNAEQSPQKSIVLSCAIHGNETAPIEICSHIIKELLNQSIRSRHRLLFLFGNIPAMHIAERFVEENLNRLFTRKSISQSQEGPRAVALMDVLDNFFSHAPGEKFHYDLHTAIRPSKNEKFAVYPFLHGKAYSKQQLGFLGACDVKTILLSQSPTTTFSYYSSVTHSAHAFTVELGKVKPFGENNMGRFVAVNQKLRELITQSDVSQPDYPECELEIYTVNQVINKSKDDFRLHFADDIANFAEFKQGQILASESGAVYKAEYDGEAIVFPNANVAIGQRAILTVIPYVI